MADPVGDAGAPPHFTSPAFRSSKHRSRSSLTRVAWPFAGLSRCARLVPLSDIPAIMRSRCAYTISRTAHLRRPNLPEGPWYSLKAKRGWPDEQGLLLRQMSSQTRWRPGSCWRLSGPTAWPVSVPLRTPSPRREGCRLQRTRSLLTACYD
ncbi:hypothetical protein DICSQDRAFT_153818 [Dichomitus squalens LYAD-421 SS1]|uniref:uncharacterized protein n=1 Tax=Dichomitus squalens (strain LYAD-421) TaxID=732165 RepID=UPI0004413723|nr:uncharacterized protein DICSQDRAFT_153818 [Dichomitus squalens LYAD-421 SS1]EJF63243.1 hypothetical protein DICSQDRAFT_153818 [Dichomitus squalens LYAD-421 SS1]